MSTRSFPRQKKPRTIRKSLCPSFIGSLIKLPEQFFVQNGKHRIAFREAIARFLVPYATFGAKGIATNGARTLLGAPGLTTAEASLLQKCLGGTPHSSRTTVNQHSEVEHSQHFKLEKRITPEFAFICIQKLAEEPALS